jgi:hypothetical protein
MSTRTTGRTVRYAVGAVLVVAGIVCLVWGFATFTGAALDGGGSGAGRAMALFAGGGLATVIGFGLVAFTRAGALTARGGYTRVTYEQGYGGVAADGPTPAAVPPAAPPAGRTHCRSCGAAVAPEDRFCGACGTSLEPAGQA